MFKIDLDMIYFGLAPHQYMRIMRCMQSANNLIERLVNAKAHRCYKSSNMFQKVWMS